MKSVLILMSTYNGKERIIKQVESIFSQEDVDISLYIRDDGSSAETKRVLENLENRYKDKITVLYGENIGWKRSFLELVYTSKCDFDYYGFSDQDDVWLSRKLANCISMVENEANDEPKLIHCNSLSVTPSLKKRYEQEFRKPKPSSFKSAVATEYFQGCGMLWNREAMYLIQSYRPQEKNLAHDYWVGLICYLFGEIYFCPEPQFYHIRYESNSSEDGNINKGRIKRLKTLIFGRDAYMNPCDDLMKGYVSLLEKENKNFLLNVINYKTNYKCKYKIVFDKEFRRESVLSTILFKIAIICNKF